MVQKNNNINCKVQKNKIVWYKKIKLYGTKNNINCMAQKIILIAWHKK
jgi:hypothetical protein